MLDLLLPPKCLGRRGLRSAGNPCCIPVNLCLVINEKSQSRLGVIGTEWQGAVGVLTHVDAHFLTLGAGLYCIHPAER